MLDSESIAGFQTGVLINLHSKVKHAKAPETVTAAATGAVVSVGSGVGNSAIIKVVKHPLVLFGLGIAISYFIHKYRKSILSNSGQARLEE